MTGGIYIKDFGCKTPGFPIANVNTSYFHANIFGLFFPSSEELATNVYDFIYISDREILVSFQNRHREPLTISPPGIHETIAVNERFL
jgi:hypothetical protein